VNLWLLTTTAAMIDRTSTSTQVGAGSRTRTTTHAITRAITDVISTP